MLYQDNHTCLASLKKASLLLIIYLNINLIAYSQPTGGGFSESFLLRNVGARAISMAGAYTAIVNEPSAIFYNPAGLSFLSPNTAISTSYTFFDLGRSHSTIAWGQSFGDFGLGFGINNYTSGSFIGRDTKGNSLGQLRNWEFAISGSLSYSLDFASIGGTVKYLANTLQGSSTNASGYSIDLGTKFDVMDLFSFGVCVQNFASSLSWNTPSGEMNRVPFTVRTGIAMEFSLNEANDGVADNIIEESNIKQSSRYFLLGIDALMTQFENGPTLVIGMELMPHEVIGFRGGISIFGDNMGVYKFLPNNIWGGGITLRPNIKNLPFNLQFDYSISSDYISINKIVHNLSLNFQF